MSAIIAIRKYEVEDFISVDSGTSAVTMTVFNGRIHIGEYAWAKSVELTPIQARQLAAELLRRANQIAKNKE